MAGYGQPPDPASVFWESAAAQFLADVIAAKGEWHAVPVADPSDRLVRLLAENYGYKWNGPDNKSGRGSLNARDAWRRAFIRAVYRANDRRRGGPGRPIQLQVGVKLPRRGVIPPRRPVRGRVRRGGAAAMKAVNRLPESQQWSHGGAGQSDPAKRYWL